MVITRTGTVVPLGVTGAPQESVTAVLFKNVWPGCVAGTEINNN